MIVDLSLANEELYADCQVEEIAGRRNLVTPVGEAVSLVGRNIERTIARLPAHQRDECVLSGAMAIWAYLVVFHAVVHRFRRVLYDDGVPDRCSSRSMAESAGAGTVVRAVA